MQSRFPASPVTVVVDTRGQPEVWIGERVTWAAESEPPIVVTLHGMDEERWFPMSDLVEVAPQMWQGQIVEGGPTVTVRPTVQGDTVPQIGLPLPLAVISQMVSSEGLSNMDFYALSEDDGFVVTMMLNTDAGLYVRYSGAWHLITDDDVVDGLNFVQVENTALDMFDQFDRAGQLVHVSAMPGADTTVVDTGSGPAETSSSTPVTAGVGARKTVPVLSSADDLPDAIQAALEDPDLRWWVERRVKAMGIEADLPWA